MFDAPDGIIQAVLTGCAGRATCVGGLWRIVAGGWISPVVSFTDDDLTAPMKWLPVRKYRDKYNGVRGRFVCPSYPYNQYGPGYPNNVKAVGIFDGQWQSCDMPYYAQDSLHGYAGDANLTADNNTRLWLDLTLPYTTSVATAQRIAKVNLLRNRQQGTGTIQVGLRGLQVSALDTIYLSHARYGWVNKIFEVSAWRLQMHDAQDGNGPLAYVEMDIQEAASSVYSWTTSEELGIEDNPSPVLPGRGIVSQAAFAPVSSANLNSAILGGINPLTAADIGTSCDIDIAAFQLQLGWGVVNYNSGVDHGCAYSTRYYVYTKDPAFTGGSVTYYAALTFAECVSAQENVYVGSIVTPAAGGSATAGSGVGGGGGSGITATGAIWLTSAFGSTAVNWSSAASGDSLQVRGFYGSVSTPTITTWEFISGAATQTPGGAAVYSYMVVAFTSGGEFASDIGKTTTGAGTLSGSNYFVAVNWNAVPGATHYDVYRTAAAGAGYATGRIASGVTAHTWINDTGLASDGTAAPNRYLAIATGPNGSADVTTYETNAASYGSTVTFQLYDWTEQFVLAQTT